MPSKRAKKLKVVEVRWGDAWAELEDFDPEKAHTTEPVYRYTVGYLVAKNQHGLVLSTDRYEDPEDGLAAKMFIPKGMVLEVKVLT